MFFATHSPAQPQATAVASIQYDANATSASLAMGTVRSPATDCSVLICAGVLLALYVGGQRFAPKDAMGRRVRMALLVSLWYWTTTTWATETKQILAVFTADSNEAGFPLLGFWLTFIPQLMSTVLCALGLYWRFGASVMKEMTAIQERGRSFWLVAGAGYWYGQFFTIQSLVFGTPALTFIVKTAEPLSTALLAVLVLKRPFSAYLFLGIVAACLGIMVTVASADAGSDGSNQKNQWQLAGMSLALLANLGFSTRACVAKKAISHLKMDPFETYAMMTIVGAQAGLLPLIAYGVFQLATPSAVALWACPFFDPRFSAFSWFIMCLSYMLYQTASVLVLSSIAVESHALLVAMKHMLVVVLVSILVHAHLTRGIIFGMILTMFGVYLYMSSSAKDSDAQAKEEDTSTAHEDPQEGEETTLFVAKGWPIQHAVAAWQAPSALNGIVSAVVLLGTVTPVAISAFKLHS